MFIPMVTYKGSISTFIARKYQTYIQYNNDTDDSATPELVHKITEPWKTNQMWYDVMGKHASCFGLIVGLKYGANSMMALFLFDQTTPCRLW